MLPLQWRKNILATLATFRPIGLVSRLRRRVRASEPALIILAIGVGLVAGLLTLMQGKIAHGMQALLYGLSKGDRLSAQTIMAPISLLALPAGGLALAAVTYAFGRRGRAPIDVVEANALHGGAIPMRDSLAVTLQTLISNGSGASVGLEAAYAQLAGGMASVVGQWLRLRRADLRVLVGAGAGAAVGAAFGAPLTGAFYAFEIVIGSYTAASIAPVMAASLAAALIVRIAGAPAYLIALPTAEAIATLDYLLFASLGLICGVVGVAVMRAVTLAEVGSRRLPVPDHLRPALGGFLLIPLAMITPQALSAGHGALHLNLTTQVSLGFLAVVFGVKILASVISLGFGFRGGLFFASLFLGSLLGQIFAGLINLVAGTPFVSASDAALVGMAAMAVAVVGGPMTMSLLVLEATHDFSITAVAITASLCSGTLVRAIFGFSFSTWRLHTRGETIRSARDIGWIRLLTAGRMMKSGERQVDASISIATFRRQFPLGSVTTVVALGPDRRYEGLVRTANAFDAALNVEEAVSTIVELRTVSVPPEMNATDIMHQFELAEADVLAVVDPDRRVLGTVSERHVQRRYVDEIEKAQREMFGE
jgi:CIC family chloride channel protein